MRAHVPLVAIVGLVLGLFLGIELHLQSSANQNLPYKRFLAMTRLLQQQRDRHASLQAELGRLRGQAAPRVVESVLQAKERELAKANAAAGFTPFTGPGIVLTLNDSVAPSQFGVDPNEYLLHDQDLLAVIDDLNSAGARAISLNGIRLTATTDVHCAGAVVSVGGVRTSIPVTILAAGKPAALTKSLEGSAGEIALLSLYGIQVDLRQASKLTVPAYTPQPARKG